MCEERTVYRKAIFRLFKALGEKKSKNCLWYGGKKVPDRAQRDQLSQNHLVFRGLKVLPANSTKYV